MLRFAPVQSSLHPTIKPKPKLHVSKGLQGFELADKRYYYLITGVSPDAFRENHTLVYGFPLAVFSYSLYLCTRNKEMQ